MLADLNLRFGERQKKAARLGQLLPRNIDPDTDAKAVLEAVKPSLSTFKSLLASDICERSLKAEVQVWTSQWKRAVGERPQSAVEALDVCSAAGLPAIHGLLQVLATLPLSTCSVERIFSKVKLTNSRIRCTQSEERLEACLLVQVNRDNLPSHEQTLSQLLTRASP